MAAKLSQRKKKPLAYCAKGHGFTYSLESWKTAYCAVAVEEQSSRRTIAAAA